MSKFTKLFLIALMLGATVTLAACGKKEATNKADIEAIVKNYILEHPEVLIEAVQKYQQRSEADLDKKAETEILNRKDEIFKNPASPVAGNPKGKIQIVEFFDYNCGYCRKMLPDITKLINENKDVKIIFKEMPILGPTSQTGALAALAANDIAPEKYFAFHTALMNHSGPKDEAAIKDAADKAGIDSAKVLEKMKDKKYADALNKNVELGTALNVNGTPTFILNGKMIRGAVGYQGLENALAGKDPYK